MTQGRLNTSVEVTGLLRKAESAGDFGAVLKRGDAERGSLLIVVRGREGYVACLERTLSLDGRYSWVEVGPDHAQDDRQLAEFLDRRTTFDPDLWLIELDVAQPERFIAETTSAG